MTASFTTPMAAPPHLEGLRAAIERFDAIICDVWGVLHNGIAATSGAGEALAAARQAGCPVALLTNAPRPPDSVARQIAELGIGPASYDLIISSGGVTRDLLAEMPDRRFYHLGHPRNELIYSGLGRAPVPLEAAEVILCSGLFDDETETAEDYRAMLTGAQARGLPMICANPDLVVERGDRLLPCAGALALLYEELGGEVIWVGKPKGLVYDRALAALEGVAGRPLQRARVLCIGDAIRTDVAGAVAAGFPCLMVVAGIHAHEAGWSGGRLDSAALAAFLAASPVRPAMTMVSLRW